MYLQPTFWWGRSNNVFPILSQYYLFKCKNVPNWTWNRFKSKTTTTTDLFEVDALCLEDSLENTSIIVWMVPSVHAVHTCTRRHTPASVHQHQSSQTIACARQLCHPSADGRVWSCLFYVHLMPLSPFAYPCCLNNVSGFMQVCVCFSKRGRGFTWRGQDRLSMIT